MKSDEDDLKWKGRLLHNFGPFAENAWFWSEDLSALVGESGCKRSIYLGLRPNRALYTSQTRLKH